MGAIGTIAERSLELMISDEMTGKRFGERMRDLLMHNLSMNPTPQLIKPMIDLYANKDGFSGREIETQGMEKLRPEDRYTNRTSEVARFLGQIGLPNPAQLLMGRVEGCLRCRSTTSSAVTLRGWVRRQRPPLITGSGR